MRTITIRTNNKNIRWNPAKTVKSIVLLVVAITIAIRVVSIGLPLLRAGLVNALDNNARHYDELHQDKVGMTTDEYLESLQEGGR